MKPRQLMLSTVSIHPRQATWRAWLNKAILTLGILALIWHGAVLADSSTSPYREPPGEGPRLVGLDGHLIKTPTLCSPDELIAFSCSMPNKKIVSLCASQDVGKNSGYLQYRFGKDPSSIELKYPKEKSPPKTSFKYVLEEARLGMASAISFWVGSYRYSLFLTKTTYADIAGVVVDRDGKMAMFHECINSSVAITQYVRSPVDSFSLSDLGLPDAGNDISFANMENLLVTGVTGVQALTIGSATHPTEDPAKTPLPANNLNAPSK